MAKDSSSEGGFASLRSVADGASLHYVATVVVNLVGFALNLLLTRALGASVYGVYAYGTMVISSVLTFSNFGADVSVTKYLSANHDDRSYQNGVLGLSYATTLVISVATAAGIYLAAPTINAHTLAESEFTMALRIFAVALPFQAITRIAANTFRGLEMPVGKTVILLSGPSTRLVAVAGAVAVGYSLLGVAAAYAVACVMVCLFAVSYSLSRTDLTPSWGLGRGDVREFYNYSAPLTFSKASSFLFKRVDLFMVGFLLTSTHVGVYNVAVLLATVISMPLAGLNQFFPPVASRLHSNGDYEALESVYATVTRWSITASVMIALPLFVYRAEVLALFGTEFVAGTAVVALFVVGQLFNAAAGPSNDLLTMTDHQYLVMVNHATFGFANVALNYVFILEFGLVGAAMATAGVLALLNVVRALEVWLLEGLLAYSIQLWKPLAAGGLAIAAMYGAKLSLEGLALLVVGSALGTAVFLGALYLFGIDDRDRELATEYFGIVS